MRQAADYVLASFAAHAPKDVKLVVKEHPLDFASFGRWRAYAEELGPLLGGLGIDPDAAQQADGAKRKTAGRRGPKPVLAQ